MPKRKTKADSVFLPAVASASICMRMGLVAVTYLVILKKMHHHQTLNCTKCTNSVSLYRSIDGFSPHWGHVLLQW